MKVLNRILLVSFFLVPTFSQAFTLINWNSKHLGRKSADLKKMARLLRKADIIALQEVNNPKTGLPALEELAGLLTNSRTGPICYILSDLPSGEDSIRYAFLWKLNKIRHFVGTNQYANGCPEDKIVPITDSLTRDQIRREPAWASFYSLQDRSAFILVNIHLLPPDRQPWKEVPHLFKSFEKTDAPVLIAGDFNLGEHHKAFETALTRGYEPALIGVKTTLKAVSREYSSPLDNIWFRGLHLIRAQRIDVFDTFPRLSPKKIRSAISDHAPVLSEWAL